ncbi:ATP-dependent DNA helicase [Methanosarcina horonobensis HB-1 = JCM 15518]|uniref:ATP-dependent DNA helicase n=1 Tax=Methanosarcina horonobensis HB-1 = JCM 15518 TaxID=1434110 RepID=A0A0E3WVG5_9EURY|nr:hypothetical protein [Methanosarcina horonobensis]AKB77800.1 ATP-dependent DNA helicase [Methanosarcina horonobensis HB-1 = JCM 15518]
MSCFERHRKLVEKDLESLRLVARHQGHLVPTVGGMLLFDHIEIHEHLPVAVERAMEFLKKHAMREADFSELRRKDIWSIPLTIL